MGTKIKVSSKEKETTLKSFYLYVKNAMKKANVFYKEEEHVFTKISSEVSTYITKVAKNGHDTIILHNLTSEDIEFLKYEGFIVDILSKGARVSWR